MWLVCGPGSVVRRRNEGHGDLTANMRRLKASGFSPTAASSIAPPELHTVRVEAGHLMSNINFV